MTESGTQSPQQPTQKSTQEVPSRTPHATPQRWHRMTVLSWLTLIALLLVWHQRVPTPQPMTALLIGLLPLLIPAPWLFRGRRNAALALAVISLLYFCHAIVALTSDQGEQLWAAAELLVSSCLFASSTMLARVLR